MPLPLAAVVLVLLAEESGTGDGAGRPQDGNGEVCRSGLHGVRLDVLLRRLDAVARRVKHNKELYIAVVDAVLFNLRKELEFGRGKYERHVAVQERDVADVWYTDEPAGLGAEARGVA
jgi:hypothetical protein